MQRTVVTTFNHLRLQEIVNTKYGTENIIYKAYLSWPSLSNEIESNSPLSEVKERIKLLNGNNCSCRLFLLSFITNLSVTYSFSILRQVHATLLAITYYILVGILLNKSFHKKNYEITNCR